MPKNIIICADGTGNTTIKGRGTNVFKLYESIDTNRHRLDSSLIQQVAIYHDGVGTESLKWLRIFAGATGWGLSRNVKQLYGELARVYETGDRIFLFGFSRGAFTVRTVAGLITSCGILDVNAYATNHAFARAVRRVYTAYRRKYQTWLSRVITGPRRVDPGKLRQDGFTSVPGLGGGGPPVIAFVGVWDTVDAVGLPFRAADIINAVFWRFKFPDTMLSPKVGHGCHALAVDEARESFAPVLWDKTRENPRAPRIEQVWFAGVHSNVGGGYPRQGMSLVALDWMMSRAERDGLRFHPAQRQTYRDAADVNDKLYDSRAGFGVLYRWKPRNIEALCQTCRITPKVHRSVLERIARNTEGYSPGTLPTRLEVVSTSAAAARLAALAQIVEAAFAGGPPLVRRAAGRAMLLRVEDRVLILSLVSFGGLCARSLVRDSVARAHGFAVVPQVASDVFSSQWFSYAVITGRHYPWIVAVAAAAFVGMLSTNAALLDGYSSFWHSLRNKLGPAM